MVLVIVFVFVVHSVCPNVRRPSNNPDTHVTRKSFRCMIAVVTVSLRRQMLRRLVLSRRRLTFCEINTNNHVNTTLLLLVCSRARQKKAPLSLIMSRRTPDQCLR